MPEEQLPTQPIKTVSGSAEAVREQDKVMLILSYLGILALIPLLTVKDSSYVQWHAKNGLVLGVGGSIAGFVLSAVFAAIPFLGWVGCLLWPGLLVLHIMAIIKALNGIRWRIPGVSDVADRI